MQPEDYYRQKLESFQETLKKYRSKRNLLTGFKITLFLLAVFLIFTFTRSGNSLYIWGSILSMILFIVTNGIETRLLKKIAYTTELKRCAETELNYLGGIFTDLPTGDEFRNQKHPYSHDLDLFGDESLFQAINRTVTPQGKAELVNRLLNPLKSSAEIILRQQAIGELNKTPDWCNEFRAIGQTQKLSGLAIKQAEKWQQEDISISPAWKSFLYILPAIDICLWILCIFGSINYNFPLYFSLGMLGIVFSFTRKINGLHAQLDIFIRSFSKLHELIRHFARFSCDSEKLRQLHQTLFASGRDAHKAFTSLHNTLESFDQRGNILAAIILNGLYLKDLHLMMRLARWKKEYGESIPDWIKAVGELDELVSLATYSFNHPDFVIPQPDKQYILKGEKIGHPLLPGNVCVTNDFQVSSLHEFYIITGANMAGKSTFLRSIGVNLILAHCGSVVCAETFYFQPVSLFSSMRTADNLAKGTSYFHAELIRLKQLVEMSKHEEKLFIILDEILKGTNSVDKLNGSIRFLQKLRTLPISGLIATHDLELGKLADSHPENYINNCFEITHTDDDIAYDYKLKDGISQNMNASILLEKMGLV